LAYVHIQDEQCTKLNMKTCKCVFVGYDDLQGVKNYHLYDKDKWKYLVNLDVTFDEEKMLKSKQFEKW
jgi:hypothetical protein